MTSLVLPAYNPGPAVEQTVDAVRDFLRTRKDRWEVLFVCDGCTDGTPARLARLVGADPRFRVLSYPANRGKGHAVRTGLLAARGRWRVFTDVDLQFLDGVPGVVAALRAGAAVAVGSRTHPDSRIALPPRLLVYVVRRKVQSAVFSRLARTLLPVTLGDTQAGLKGMTAAVAERVLPALTCDGFGFDCELLTALVRFDIPVAEVPVCVRFDDAASSTAGLRNVARMVRELWAIRRAWRDVRPLPAPAARRPAPAPAPAPVAA